MRSFIGMANYYRDFWHMRAHIMAPLSAATGKNNSGCGKIASTPQLVQAFEYVKRSIAEKVLLTYPDPNKTFDILTDASDKQLGAVIAQEGKVIAVGPGAKSEDGKTIPMDVKVGDRVLFGKWSGTEVKVDGKEYSIMKESDIMGVVGK